MAMNTISHDDAHSMAGKLAQFIDSLEPGERAAFEAIERQISLLVMTDDLEDEKEHGASENQREALWYKLATG